MASNDNSTSTVKSYVDSAVGAVQEGLGKVLGTTGDQAQGQAKQNKAEAEYDASHATAKIGNLTASGSGAVTKDNPDRTAGAWNQTVGSAKEAAGGVLGSEVRDPPHLSHPKLPTLPPRRAHADFSLCHSL